LGISKKLAEEGVDTSAAREQLQKSLVVISTRLNDLLLGEPSIELNGEKFSIHKSLEEKYLLESRRLFLESGDDETGSA